MANSFIKAKYGKANLCALLATLYTDKRTFFGHFKSIKDEMLPVDSASGSRFGEDVIRITGSDAFCEAVLARVADLIEVERSDNTRLDASWSEVKGEKFAKGKGGNSIYLRMALRGRTDSPMAQAHRSTRVRYE